MTDLPGLDLARLATWFDGACPGELGGPLEGRLIAGGRSNLTYEVGDGTRSWVVRRPPLGHVLATAHDMEREYRVITALRDTAVPVPLTYALCADPDVVGAPFYVMSDVDGVVYRTDDQLAAVGPAPARIIAERLISTLAQLHAVVPAEVGLADFGRPQGFLARQVRRWKKQLDASRSRPLAGIDELHALLAADPPDGSPPAIVHGDYRLDNGLVGADGQLRARLSQRAGGARPVRRGQRAGPFRPWLLHRPRVVQGGGDPRGHPFQVRPRPDGRRGVRGDRHPGRAPGRFRTGRDAGRGKLMEFGFDERTEELQVVLREFMDAYVYPAEAVFTEQLAALENRWAWSTVPVLAELRAEARAKGLWNLFLPGEHGAGLTNLQYAPLAEVT